MPFTLDQLNALDAAIAQGALKVKYADKEVEYRSLNEMLALRELMTKEIKGTPTTRVYGTFSKGL